MGKAALKTDAERLHKGIISFVRFLDSLDMDPKELPEEDIKCLAEASGFLQHYLKILDNTKSISRKTLRESEANIRSMDEVCKKAQDSLLDFILEHIAVPRESQFREYSAYTEAEKAWYDYQNFVKEHNLERFSLKRIQSLIDRTQRPDRIAEILFSRIKISVQNIGDIEKMMSVMMGIINHTPRSEFNSKTPYQKAMERKHSQFEEFKKKMDDKDFTDYDFDNFFNKLGSKDAEDRKLGQKLLEKLWNDYVDEKHGRLKTQDKKHHKNIVALWREVKKRFYGAKDAHGKLNALKPFTKLWCTFIPEEFYDEVKELMLKGLDDESGSVRYRIVRVIQSVMYPVREYSPQNFKDFYKAIYDKRESYIKDNKLGHYRKAYSWNIKDERLRSLTQAWEDLLFAIGE